MDNLNRLYRCNLCNKDYSSYKSLWNHNSKFHNDTNENVKNDVNNVKIDVKIVKSLTCDICNKVFNSRGAKSMHKKICQEKFVETENMKLKKEIEILEKKLIAQPVQTKQLTTNNNSNNNTKNINNIQNNTNTNSHNSINNGTINNNNFVVINQIGTERIADVPINDIRSIINSDINSIITCTKKVNFNKKLPQYHSFCATTLEGDHFTKINHETQKPEKINKKDFINEVLNSSIKFLNDISVMIEFDEEFRNKISLSEQQKIKDIVKFQDKFHEVKNKRAFFQSINDISYNCKDLILKTWENVQPVEDYNSDAEYSEPDIDPNFKGFETEDSDTD